MDNPSNVARTTRGYFARRKRDCDRVENLLDDGQRRRAKDIAEDLEISLAHTKQALSTLLELKRVTRTESVDLRERSRNLVPWFHIPQEDSAA